MRMVPAQHLGATALLVFAQCACALEGSLDALYVGEYTTNAGRDSDDTVGEWIHQPGARVAARHFAPTVELDAAYDVRRRFHKQDFSDDTVARGTSSILWRVIPNRFSLDASDTRTETTIDSRGQFEPDNRQRTATTAVGATVNIDSIRNHRIDVRYSYALNSYDETDSDANRHIGNVNYVIPLSEVQEIRLRGDVKNVDFENELSPDYESREAGLQYKSIGYVVDLELAAGYQEIDRELLRDTVYGTTANALIRWHAGPETDIALRYTRSLEDESTDRLLGIPGPGEQPSQSTGLNEVFLNEEIRLTLDTAIANNRVELQAYKRSQAYEDANDQDEDSVGARLLAARQIRPGVEASLFAAYEVTDFEVDDTEADNRAYGGQLLWDPLPRLEITAAAGYFEGSGDLVTSDYEEWRGVLTVIYRLVGRP